VPHNFLKW